MNTYISVDVEASGPIPGQYDMIELGAAVYNPRTYEFNTFSVALKSTISELQLFPSWGWHLPTQNWWHRSPESTATLYQIEQESVKPADAMASFKGWISQFVRPVLVAWPAAYDAMFLKYYWHLYVDDRPPWSHSALDLKTMAMIIMGCDYRDTDKRTLKAAHPAFFRDDLPHTHRAVDDAREQAFLHYQMATYIAKPLIAMPMRQFSEEDMKKWNEASKIELKYVSHNDRPGLFQVSTPFKCTNGCLICDHPMTDHSDEGGCYVTGCQCSV